MLVKKLGSGLLSIPDKSEVISLTFDAVWQNIISCAGQEFHTKNSLPFTYKMKGESIVPNRTDYPLAKSQFQKAFSASQLTGPGQINGQIRGPSYVFAILTDPRINNGHETSCENLQ